MSAESADGETTPGYSFRLGVNYRHRAGDFDSSGYCTHALVEHGGHEVRFSCAVDCEGGGINVLLSKDDKSAIVRLEAIVVWQNNKQAEDAAEALLAGADDKVFRLDRAAADECDAGRPAARFCQRRERRSGAHRRVAVAGLPSFAALTAPRSHEIVALFALSSTPFLDRSPGCGVVFP